MLAWAGRRTDTPERGLVASLLFAGLALGHVLAFELPPTSLVGPGLVPVAYRRGRSCPLALAGIAAAYRDFVEPLAWAGAALAVYLASGLVVDRQARRSTT